MIRLFGALLITAGTAAWGLMNVFRLRRRVVCLQSLAGAVGLMASEICAALTPMPELLRRLSDDAAYPASCLYKNASEKMSALGDKPFSSIWTRAVRETPELLLTSEESLALEELGLFLGRYDVDEQKSALRRAQRRIEDFERRAEAERVRNSKVYGFLGFAAGVFAVVVLL